jgi:hypothetical protein
METRMTFKLQTAVVATAFFLTLSPAVFAQDAMSSDAMAPGAMTPISDEDYAVCMEQANTMTFPAAARAAGAACHGLHEGMDVMGAMDAMEAERGPMTPDAMASDAMAPTQQ